MATAAPITPAPAFKLAHTAFATAPTMRRIVHGDDDTTAVEELVAPFYDRMVCAPAHNLDDVRMKLAAVMAEAGTGLVEVEDLAFIARDLDVLLGRAAQ